eukprot:scaffold1954_cov63-Phaeocystis_antarctica.AAC.4
MHAAVAPVDHGTTRVAGEHARPSDVEDGAANPVVAPRAAGDFAKHDGLRVGGCLLPVAQNSNWHPLFDRETRGAQARPQPSDGRARRPDDLEEREVEPRLGLVEMVVRHARGGQAGRRSPGQHLRLVRPDDGGGGGVPATVEEDVVRGGEEALGQEGAGALPHVRRADSHHCLVALRHQLLRGRSLAGRLRRRTTSSDGDHSSGCHGRRRPEVNDQGVTACVVEAVLGRLHQHHRRLLRHCCLLVHSAGGRDGRRGGGLVARPLGQ